MLYKSAVKLMYNRVQRDLGLVSNKPKLKIKGWGGELQATDNVGSIHISKKLAQLVHLEPILVQTILAHELTHNKYGDTKTNRKNLYRRFSKRYQGCCLLHELRASIEGYAYGGKKTEAEIWELEKKFKFKKIQRNVQAAYKVGYPTSIQIAHYASRSDKLSVAIAREILEDYCEVIGIKDKENYIAKTIRLAKVEAGNE